MKDGYKEVRAYVPEEVAERLARMSSAMRIPSREVNGTCIEQGMDKAFGDFVKTMERELAFFKGELEPEPIGNGTSKPGFDPLPPARKGRAEKAAEVKRERDAEARRRGIGGPRTP